MTQKELEARRLIYGSYNTIVVDGKEPKEIIEQIELVRSQFSIDGFIFRPEFATTEELTDYTAEDWAAILAQYSMTYGWSEWYGCFFGVSAKDVLDEYFKDAKSQKASTLSTPKKKFKLATTEFYSKVLKELAESKTVLRKQQIDIIENVPVKYLLKTANEEKFTIKETEILFLRRAIEEGGREVYINDPDQIVRLVTASYRSNGEGLTGQLNKQILKYVKVKFPTKAKKVLWSVINKYEADYALAKMHKYKNFWKRLLAQLAWTDVERLRRRFPNAMIIKDRLFSGEYEKFNTKIEMFKAEGYLDKALKEEMKNPGQMLRNLLQYLRYSVGDLRPTKNNDKEDKPWFGIHDYFESPERISKKNRIKADVSGVISSEEFYETLLKTNPKLLWQTFLMLMDDSIYLPTEEKEVYKVTVRYSPSLPGVRRDLGETVKRNLLKAIATIKRKQNIGKGKFFVDEEAKSFIIEFSGRQELSTSLSGEYIPSGSVLSFEELLKGEDKLLRTGIAWRGENSCDIDLSLTLDEGSTVYYNNPVYKVDGKVAITSSGDITMNGKDLFSVELVDIDLDLIKKSEASTMISSAIMYSGDLFDSYEVYWFMNIIDKKDRIIENQKVKIKLDEMDYAIQVNHGVKSVVGLEVNLDEGAVRVHNIPLQTRDNCQNAAYIRESIEEATKSNKNNLTIGKAFDVVLSDRQKASDYEEADVIVSRKLCPEGKKVLHPGRDMAEIQKLIF